MRSRERVILLGEFEIKQPFCIGLVWIEMERGGRGRKKTERTVSYRGEHREEQRWEDEREKKRSGRNVGQKCMHSFANRGKNGRRNELGRRE